MLTGQNEQLAVHIKALTAAAGVESCKQLLAAVLYFLVVCIELYGIQLAARMDDERQVFLVIVVLIGKIPATGTALPSASVNRSSVRHP